MNDELVRQVMANRTAAEAATREARELTARAYSEAAATIRRLQARDRERRK